ncbi:MAG: hypothetical protein H6600_07645 [Flavobacteriales bacterium]|nr:hypothetical protein [Flavobacteriales bacterium]MCB9198316.1 hypothetical protein [Flavobacteriales bacterium]
MRILLPLFILFSIGYQAKTLDIQQCLDLIEFKPENYASGDFSFEGLVPTTDLKNGYYEIVSPYTNITYVQAAKFNNGDGSITLMITGYEYDMVCERYNTTAYLILPEEDNYIEMSLHDLNLDIGIENFQSNPTIKSVLEELLIELRGNYLDENASLESLYNELFDFHFILPQKGTDIITTISVCDYIPLNEIDISEENWNILLGGRISKTMQYDKKFIQFK